MLRDDPDNPQAAFILALCLMRRGQYETAYHVTRSVGGYTDLPQIKHNLAHCLAEMGQMKPAEHFFLEAIKGQETPEAWSSLASVYAKLGDWPAAVNSAEKALAINPDHKDAKWNASLAMLALKRWDNGWDWWDTAIGTRMRPLPKWLGSDLKPWAGEKDAILLVTGEQGLGDEIMFASQMPDLIAYMGGADRIYMAVEKRLVGLFSRSFGVYCADRTEAGLRLMVGMPPPTHYIPIGSLGRMFRLSDDHFPGTPYLKPDPQRVTMWKALLASLGPGKKVGINWEGGVPSTGYAVRSFQAIDWAHAWKPGLVFVSLNHKDKQGYQAQRFYEITGIPLHHFGYVHSQDYDDTAALVAALDEVATVTTTVAHLAGALGKRVHVYVPPRPQWRYGLTGNRCLWYRSMKLYRQTKNYMPGYGFMPFDDIRDAM